MMRLTRLYSLVIVDIGYIHGKVKATRMPSLSNHSNGPYTATEFGSLVVYSQFCFAIICLCQSIVFTSNNTQVQQILWTNVNVSATVWTWSLNYKWDCLARRWMFVSRLMGCLEKWMQRSWLNDISIRRYIDNPSVLLLPISILTYNNATRGIKDRKVPYQLWSLVNEGLFSLLPMPKVTCPKIINLISFA